MKNLKLFIWTDFMPNYSGGLAFAIAENETQAKKLIKQDLIKQDCTIWENEWGTLEIRSLTLQVARCIIGGN